MKTKNVQKNGILQSQQRVLEITNKIIRERQAEQEKEFQEKKQKLADKK
jgi:hypothetical protein